MGPLDTSPGFPLHLFCFSDFDTVDASSQAGPSGETGLHGRRFSFLTLQWRVDLGTDPYLRAELPALQGHPVHSHFGLSADLTLLARLAWYARCRAVPMCRLPWRLHRRLRRVAVCRRRYRSCAAVTAQSRRVWRRVDWARCATIAGPGSFRPAKALIVAPSPTMLEWLWPGLT